MVSFYICVFCKFIFFRNKNYMLSFCNNKKFDWIFKYRKFNRYIYILCNGFIWCCGW